MACSCSPDKIFCKAEFYGVKIGVAVREMWYANSVNECAHANEGFSLVEVSSARIEAGVSLVQMASA